MAAAPAAAAAAAAAQVLRQTTQHARCTGRLTQAHAEGKGVLQRLGHAVHAHAAAARQRLLVSCRKPDSADQM